MFYIGQTLIYLKVTGFTKSHQGANGLAQLYLFGIKWLDDNYYRYK